MWSLVFLMYLNGALVVTHIDSFISHKLCDKAGRQLITHAVQLDKALTASRDSQYTCVLEID